jgi:hypothetical protein
MNLSPFLLALVATGSLVNVEQQAPPTECPELDRVVYSAPRRDWPGSVVIETRPAQPAVKGQPVNEPHRSPQGTAFYVTQDPDMSKPGPWSTVVDIFGNGARPLHLRVRIDDHGNGGVRAMWLNEKLLWIQMWRGRIVSTDMVLDIDARRLIYEEDANYNSLIVPCSMKRSVPK